MSRFCTVIILTHVRTVNDRPRLSNGLMSDSAAEHHDVEMEFFDHLEELRRRLVRALIWAAFGVAVSWYLVPAIEHLLTNPLQGQVDWMWRNLYDGFMLYVKIGFFGGLIVFAPLILYEAWAFVAPALTPAEKKFVWLTLPFSVLLFFAGVAMCYACIPLFARFFLPYFRIIEDSQPTIDAAAFIGFLMMCFLAFGLCFQMPLVVIFLAKLGIVDYKFLAQYRRHAYFLIMVIASIVTPTWDPFTMMACALPVCVLYEFSIWIVRFFIKPL